MATTERIGKSHMKILMTGYEVEPFYKRGGLGDVMGSLPIALKKQGIDIRVVMPYYKVVWQHYHPKQIGSFVITFNNKQEEVVIYQDNLPNSTVPIYFLANHKLITIINLNRKHIEEFIFFDLAVCGFVNWLESQGSFVPQLVHCNDWHTALIPLILQKRMQSTIPTLLTIHNLGYQGMGPLAILQTVGIIDSDIEHIKKRSYKGKLNALGEGILHATKISTVSKTYAEEISHFHKRAAIYSYFRLRQELGRKDKVVGILNGIDDTIWNPASDKAIGTQYNKNNFTAGKKRNKAALLDLLNLPNRPTFAFIGRLAKQKGLNILAQAVPLLQPLGINIVILGTGDGPIETFIKSIAKQYEGFVRAETFYNEEVARKIYAGADFLLIPSLYEPCGLIQIIAMRYGTIPVASRTGGLVDTIEDGKTGFLFKPDSSASLVAAVKRALALSTNQKSYEEVATRAMQLDFSWGKSAKSYKDLYTTIIEKSKE